jgi:hypothetical protein
MAVARAASSVLRPVSKRIFAVVSEGRSSTRSRPGFSEVLAQLLMRLGKARIFIKCLGFIGKTVLADWSWLE